MRKRSMKKSLRLGIEHEFSFLVPKSKTVPALYPESAEFQKMPEILATGFMVGLMEWTCIQAVNPHIDWPREQTVGIRIDMSHIAPTPPGLSVKVNVRLVEVEGRKLIFEIEARDDIELIGKGMHERFIIYPETFLEKVRQKSQQIHER